VIPTLSSHVSSGNQLDSSTPIRYKGRQKEIKPLTLSRLKTGIIRDRINKKLQNTGLPPIENGRELKEAVGDYLKELRDEKKPKEISGMCAAGPKPVTHSTSSLTTITFTSKFRR